MRNIILFVLMGFLLANCSSKYSLESFVRGDIDLTYISQIAVMPFENNSQEKYVGERVRDLTTTSVLASGLFDVVDKGIVDSVLHNEAIELHKAPMDENSRQRIAQLLNIQAMLLGTVDHAGEGRYGSTTFPELALTLRLIDVDTGVIFWQASGTKSGESFMRQLVGMTPDDKFIITQKLIKELLETIQSTPKSKSVSNESEPDVKSEAEPEKMIEEESAT